jgi:hypothetical protein
MSALLATLKLVEVIKITEYAVLTALMANHVLTALQLANKAVGDIFISVGQDFVQVYARGYKENSA